MDHSLQNNEFKPSSKDKSKPINIYQKPLEQISFGIPHTHIKNTSNIFSPLGQNIFKSNNNKEEFTNTFISSNNTQNNPSSESRTVIIKEQTNPENTKIVKTTKTYIIDGDNLNEEEIREKFGHKLFQGNEISNLTNDKNEFINGEDDNELITKNISESKNTTTTTTTTTITKIITDGGKTMTKTEKITKVEKGDNNNADNDNNSNLFSRKIEAIPSSSSKISINSNNVNKNDNSKKRLFQNIIKYDNHEDNYDEQNMNDSNEIKNTFEYQVITDENDMDNEYENKDNSDNDNGNDNDIDQNININNHIKFTASNNNNNNQATLSFGGISFGAPKTTNYIPLSSSKVEFGINNNNSNQNNNNNNFNDSNISDSVDKSSEQGLPLFVVKNETENSNQPQSNNQNFKFGFVETKNDINNTPQKTNNLKLEDKNIKFGFIPKEPKNENKIIIAEDSKDQNANIEPGEIIDNENGGIKKEENIEIVIKEKNDEINLDKKDNKEDNTKKEDNNKEKEKEGNNKEEKKEKKKEKEKIKPEIYFQKDLFNNDENMHVEGSSLFSQKLFQNDANDNNNNITTQNNSKSLFSGLFKNNDFSLNFNSPNNQKIEENFFAKNKIDTSLLNSKNENLFGEEGKKSGTFTLFSHESKNSIIDESHKENDKKPTLGEGTKEGGISNADSQQNTEKDKNQIKESTKETSNVAFSFSSFGAFSNKTKVSPFQAYIKDNEGKNFITGDNKDIKVNNIKNRLFLFNDSDNSSNINTNSNNDNPFLKVLGENNDKSDNNKSNANILDKKPEQKAENKTLFSSIITSKSNEHENENEKEKGNPDEKNMNQIPSSDKNSKDINPFSVFNSQQKMENQPKIKEIKNGGNKPEEKKSIFSSTSSNFFTVKKDQNSLTIENKSSSSLFPGLSFEKNKNELNLPGKSSSFFPGLNLLSEQNLNKESSSLFPGLKPSNSLNIFGSEDSTKSKPLFPGGSNITKTLNIFGNNKEPSDGNKETSTKKEEKEHENKFSLFDSETNVDKKNDEITNKNEKSGTESISFGGSNPKITAVSIYASKNESNQSKNENENEKDNNDDKNENNINKSDLPLLNNIIKSENNINVDSENKKLDNMEKNEVIKLDNNSKNEEEEEKEDQSDMEIENIGINNKPKMTESPTQETQKDKNNNNNNVMISDIIISKNEQDKPNINTGSLFGKDFINQDKNKGGNSLFSTNLVENVKKDKNTTKEKPEVKSLFGGLFQNDNNKGFDSLFLNKSNSNLFEENNKHSTGLFGNTGGLFGDYSNTNSGFFEGLKNDDNKDKKNEKEDNSTEIKDNKESNEVKDSKDKIEIKYNKDNTGLFGNDNVKGLFGEEKNDKENENKDKAQDKDKDKNKNESSNLFGNNDGKSIFGGFSGINTNNNINVLGHETTPIKASTLFKNQIEKENKEKEEKEKEEKERIEKERVEKEEKEKLEKEKLEKERLEQLEREKLEKERLERINREKEENEKLMANQQDTQEIEINLKKSIDEESKNVEEEENGDDKNENEEEIEKGEEENKDDNSQNEKVEEKEEEKEDDKNENQNVEEEEGEGEGEDEKLKIGKFNGETLIKENPESESEKNGNNDIKISEKQETEIISQNSKSKEDNEENEKQEESYEKEKESDIELSFEIESNSPQNIQNKIPSTEIQNSNMNNETNILTVRKPVSRQMYSDLIQKLYEITFELQNRINLEEKYTVTIYKNTLDKYLKELEDMIVEMKQKYILTLIKKHFEKDPDKKKKIITDANIPKIRNDVKRTFMKLIMFIKNNLELPNRKYYYCQILNILNNYEVIGEDEIKKMIKLNKKNRINNGMVNGKTLQKGNIKVQKNNNDKEKDSWDMAKKRNRISFKIFTFVIPFLYIAKYVYANFKA